MSAEMSKKLITIDELAATLQAGQSLRLLDIRFDPGKGSAKSRYLEGHIPGAIYVDLPTELAGPKGSTGGNLPLPDPEAFEQVARSWGISSHSQVIVYDDTNGAPAARAAWVLRWAGIAAVSLLDGGLGAWLRAKLPTSTADEAAVPGTIEVISGALRPMAAKDVATWSGTLIDARPEKAFAEGHIPRAINIPNSALVDDYGRLLPAAQIEQRLKDRGIDPHLSIAAYCGGGVASSFTVIALASLGKHVELYPGSWSDWISDPSRPIEK